MYAIKRYFSDYLKNQDLVKHYIQNEIKKKEPTTISHDIFAIQLLSMSAKTGRLLRYDIYIGISLS